MATEESKSDLPTIHLALPKGHMQANVFQLFKDAGYPITVAARGYRPKMDLAHYDVKLLKPQNILGMLAAGSRDIGFGGDDWRQELGLEVEQVLDTGLDPVRIVVAAPDPDVLSSGKGFEGRKLIVASEYPEIAKRWIAEKGLEATFLRAYGATESLPPEDADIIIDNTATGSTLRANGLTIIEVVTTSTTRMFASKAAMANPAKKAEIDSLVTILQSVLTARKRLLVSFNVSEKLLDAVLAELPSARAPTVSPLHHTTGFAVQTVVDSKAVPTLMLKLKAGGASDILVSELKQIVA